MSRRVVLLIALISLAVLGTAAAPWSLTGSGLAARIDEHMRDRYGLSVDVEGRSTFAVLPIPRVKFENVTLDFPNGALKAEGGTLRGKIRLLPLILGRVELSDLALSDTRITGSAKALQALDWAEIFRTRPDAAYARNLILDNSSLRWTDLKDADLDNLNLTLSWKGEDKPLLVAGSARWRDELVTVEAASFYPDLLASDRISPISLAVSAPSGRLAVTGEALLGDDPQITGDGTIQAKSVRNFTRWSGMELPFGSLMQALSITGEFSMNRRRLTWPSVAVAFDGDKLEGTMAVRLDTERPLITGTLAADQLNLSDLFAPFVQARTSSGGWSQDAIDLARVAGKNLDLRLSATTAQIGRLRLDDMAANILVRPGQIEASIGRAGFHDGSLKGRLSLSTLGSSAEFKGQATFSGVDIAPFLNAIGQPRWITGLAQGQIQIEGTGKNPAELIRQAQGRSSITVKSGELVGVALDEALQRMEKRPLWASLNWKGGRTPFERAQAQLVVKDGVGELVEGRLAAPSVLAKLKGQVMLVDRTLDLKAGIAPANAPEDQPPALVFDVGGDWNNVVIMPDARSIIERSGAAKPLFGPERLSPNGQKPLATAQ